jgi:hypothetical protein
MNEKRKPGEVRPLTLALIEAVKLDQWPSRATCVDFGIKTEANLGALQYAVINDGVTAKELDHALGWGERLQRLISPSNPYRHVTFRTDYDEVREQGEPPDEDNRRSDLEESYDDSDPRDLLNSYWRYTYPDVPTVEDAARQHDPMLWICTHDERSRGTAFYVTGYSEDDLMGSCRFSGLLVDHREKAVRCMVVRDYGNGPEADNTGGDGEPLPEGMGFVIDSTFRPEKTSELLKGHPDYRLLNRDRGRGAERIARRPADLTREQLIGLVEEIVETLYPAAGPDQEWEVDTIEWVSAALARFGLVPEA